MYFRYLGAKAFWMPRNTKLTKTAENTELHGNVYSEKSVPEQDLLVKLEHRIW